MLWRAFDKTVRRKPFAFAADAVYGNSIDLVLEIIARKGVASKTCLLLPQCQRNGRDLACQRQTRHLRLHPLGQQTGVEIVKRSLATAGPGGRRFENVG
jgi:hypothetical protein